MKTRSYFPNHSTLIRTLTANFTVKNKQENVHSISPGTHVKTKHFESCLPDSFIYLFIVL